MSRPNALHPQTTWLFAFGAVAVGIGVGFLTRNLSPKISAAIYAGIVGLAGFGSMYFTRARLRDAVLAFFVAAAACAVLYYFVVSSVISGATTVMGDAVSGGQAHDQAKEAGTFFGRFFGIFAAGVAFLETLIGGIVGAIAGNKYRAQSQSGGPALARASR
jgi:Na+/melibiose symporter-like transporter